MLKYIKSKIELKKDNTGITVIASDETLDRHGDVLPIEQWDLTKFMLSPRMLVDHNHEVASIVGKWENTRIQDNKLLMDANFHDFTELAKAVKQMVENGYLDTVSVGFIPHGPEEDGGKGRFELIETSWVTVPANPSARILKDLLSNTPDEKVVAKVKDFVGNEPEPEKKEEPEPTIVDMTPEGLQEMGFDIIKSVEEFRAWKAGFPEGKNSVVCVLETPFVEKLIADSEKLKTLTDDETKVEAYKQSKLVREALREVSKGVNHSLRKLNKLK